MLISFLLAVAILIALGKAWRPLWRGRLEVATGYGISLLVPFTTTDLQRQATWDWLKEYYSAWLPGAELIVSPNYEVPFCKTRAFNTAFKRSTGDVIVLLDADCYINTEIILQCAAEIRAARKAHQKLWYVPYRNFYRLTEQATSAVTASQPTDPITYPAPPPSEVLSSTDGTSSAHWWGALIQIMPAEAFEAVGGMDDRFAGWGGEDVAFMRAVDTLYGKHKTWNDQVFHLWHAATLNPYDSHLRMWPGQKASQKKNDELVGRYYAAFGDKTRMRRLVNEK
jgi:glycosyltransferase involved in cell wall biosynthesis